MEIIEATSATIFFISNNCNVFIQALHKPITNHGQLIQSSPCTEHLFITPTLGIFYFNHQIIVITDYCIGTDINTKH